MREARATHLPNYLIVLAVVPMYRHVFIIRVGQERLRLTGAGALHPHRPYSSHTSITALVRQGLAPRRGGRWGWVARAGTEPAPEPLWLPSALSSQRLGGAAGAASLLREAELVPDCVHPQAFVVCRRSNLTGQGNNQPTRNCNSERDQPPPFHPAHHRLPCTRALPSTTNHLQDPGPAVAPLPTSSAPQS